MPHPATIRSLEVRIQPWNRTQTRSHPGKSPSSSAPSTAVLRHRRSDHADHPLRSDRFRSPLSPQSSNRAPRVRTQSARQQLLAASQPARSLVAHVVMRQLRASPAPGRHYAQRPPCCLHESPTFRQQEIPRPEPSPIRTGADPSLPRTNRPCIHSAASARLVE